MSASDLEHCRDVCVAFLSKVERHDWASPIPGIDGEVGKLVAHQSQVLFWYSLDLSARGGDVAAAVPEIDGDLSPAKLTNTLKAAATMLAAVVRSAPPDARGFHPFGRADASGFAAMGCDEMMVHTHDISRGLGVDFVPPVDLVASVLARLFPWVSGDEDPWALLLYANGRIPLPGREQLGKWLWHCAPLAEWDGTVPTPPQSM